MTAATFVTISCQTCGLSTTLPVDALLLTAAPDDARSSGRELGDDRAADRDQTVGTVTWTCAGCDDLVSARLDWAALLTLVSAGATLLEDPDSDEDPGSDEDDVIEEDALPPHPEISAGGAPLTRDDLLALHELLASDHWFSQVTDAGCVNP